MYKGYSSSSRSKKDYVPIEFNKKMINKVRNVRCPFGYSRLNKEGHLQLLQKITGEKVKDIIFFHSGFDLYLNENDLKNINTLLEEAFEIYSLIGSLHRVAFLGEDAMYFPLVKSYYKEIKNILFNDQRKLADDRFNYSNGIKKLKRKDSFYSIAPDYLFETECRHYYLLGNIIYN